MRYFTDSILLLLYSTLTFFYVPADQALVFALLFAVILCCITYLGRVCKTESCSHNSLPVLKPPEISFRSCRKLCDSLDYVPCGFRIFFYFSRCCCIRPYLLGFFLWQWLRFHFGDFWFFRSIDFRQFFVCLGFLVSFSHFFSGSMPENIRLFTRIFIKSGMTVRNIRFFFLKKTRHFWKNRITKFMLLHCASETELPERSMIMWDMYYPVLSL